MMKNGNYYFLGIYVYVNSSLHFLFHYPYITPHNPHVTPILPRQEALSPRPLPEGSSARIIESGSELPQLADPQTSCSNA